MVQKLNLTQGSKTQESKGHMVDDNYLEELDKKIKQVLNMMKPTTPSKRRTKLSGKVSPNSFNQNLKGVPGSFRYGATWTAIQRMADHPETGCRLATGNEKLDRSAQNSFTTKGNYIV